MGDFFDFNFVVKDFKWDRAGYAALQNSGAIQGMARKAADRISAAANAQVSDSMRNPAYSVSEWQGKLARGYVVASTTPHGYYAQAKRKALSRALKGGGK